MTASLNPRTEMRSSLKYLTINPNENNIFGYDEYNFSLYHMSGTLKIEDDGVGARPTLGMKSVFLITDTCISECMSMLSCYALCYFQISTPVSPLIGEFIYLSE